MTDVILRPAGATDGPSICDFLMEAGGGLFEFMFEGVFGTATPRDVLAYLISVEEGLFSYRRCHLAEVAGAAVGLLNSYPADLFHDQTFDNLRPDRSEHLAMFAKTQDWGSYYVGAAAPAHRRRRIARQLMQRAFDEAGRQGFSRVSLHVWADNAPARALYQNLGFALRATLDIAWHPRLPHRGGMLLLSRALTG